MQPLGVAVIGAGYWGPNLVRNFRGSPEWDLLAVCDLDEARAIRAVGRRSTIEVETSLERLLNRDDIDAVAVATSASTHAEIAMAALAAGKHVLVEKPLATNVTDAQSLVKAADRANRVLMCDHTYCFTPVVMQIADLIASGELGELMFIDSVRMNLGLIQSDVDVIWDLAPHDLSVIDAVLPKDIRPTGVSVHGADPLGAGRACVGYLTLPLSNGALAHIHVNWLSPTKIRRMVIGGSRKMLVWDDLNPQQRLSLYERGVDLLPGPGSDDLEQRTKAVISYRLGDMYAPNVPEREALSLMVAEFAGAITDNRAPITDGLAGMRVLGVLEAASQSLADGGALKPIRPLADLMSNAG